MKGATVLPLSVLSWSISYFNPRTREGCDPASLLLRLILHHFNPRTREGCDCNAKLPDLLPAFISIHAPVKGATFSMSPTNTAIGISIHAPVKGATQGTTFYNSKPRISIHAPVKGATSGAVCCACIMCSNFNPRTREGCDSLREYLHWSVC